MLFALINFRSNCTHVQSPAHPSQALSTCLEVEEFVLLDYWWALNCHIKTYWVLRETLNICIELCKEGCRGRVCSFLCIAKLSQVLEIHQMHRQALKASFSTPKMKNVIATGMPEVNEILSGGYIDRSKHPAQKLSFFWPLDEFLLQACTIASPLIC